MRSTVLGVVSAASLIVTSLAGSASAATQQVDGDHFKKSGVTIRSHGCDDTRANPVEQPSVDIARGPGNPPLGDHSIGWRMPGTSFGVGPSVHLKKPAKLKHLKIAAHAPDGDLQGRAVVIYHPTDRDGEWRGIAQLGDLTGKGWNTVDASDATYTWRHFSTDGVAGDSDSGTLPDLAARHGGNGHGAEVGFVFGCGGETFYVDKLVAEAGSQKKVMDFGGYTTLSDIIWGSRAYNKITITYGQKVNLTARLRVKGDQYAMKGGQAKIDSRPASKKGWHLFDKVKMTEKGGDFSAHPARNTELRMRYAGAANFEGSTQRTPLLVRVRSKVKAGLVDRTVTKGKTFTARGRVLPRRSGKVLLQRYVHHHWRTVKSGHAGRTGAFRVSARASSLGKSFWRVLATTGGGNLKNHSPSMRLTTTKPRTHHDGGGGGGTTHDDAPPPPEEPPPPIAPPPTH